MKKGIKVWIPIIAILLCLIAPAAKVQAATGKTSIAVSASTVNIGDTVTVTVKAVSDAGNSAYATMTLEYNPDVLEFSSCSATYGGGNGSISVSIDSFTVKFKAIAAGKSGITVTATDGVDFSTAEELSSMEGSSTNITVNNSAGGSNGGGTGNGGNTGTKLSADNSLKSLTISPGTLSPEFKGSTVNYTASVANKVTSVAVNAEVANEKATVESVTGNTNLAVGENVIKIVVKAENGTTATYAIKITRQAAETTTPAENEKPGNGEVETPPSELGTEEIFLKNGTYCIVKNIPEQVIPEDFSRMTVNYHGTEYPGLGFDNGMISLLYLVKADLSDPAGILAVYDETRDMVYPYTRLTNGSNYVIPLLAPVDTEIPDHYTNTEFFAENAETVSAYQLLGGDEWTKDFYLFYGMNKDGDETWYQYDALENTYQRAFNAFKSEEDTLKDEQYDYLNQKYLELKETYRRETEKAKNIIYIMIFVAAVLAVVVINVFVFYHKRRHEEEDFLEEELHLPTEPKRTKEKQTKKDVEVFDFNDED